MSFGILNGTGDRFTVFDSDDSSKQVHLGCANLLAGNTSVELVTGSADTGPYIIVATGGEGNAGDIVVSQGGAGNPPVFQSPYDAGLFTFVGSALRTGLSAAVTATDLVAAGSVIQGFYRVSWVATVTTAASVSSTLGGTNGFQITFTDPGDNVVKTSNPQSDNHMSSTGNTTATTVSGTLCAYCKVGTALQYAFDYTSSGGTAMVYNLRVTAELLHI